jgi:hypothetical protein
MKVAKVISNRILGLKRLIKFFGLGKDDVQEIIQISPFGIDSVPIKDMVAVYSETSVKGESVLVGYINKSLVAQSGDFRTYSVNSSGEVQFYIWQKNNGTAEIGGNVDNMVRYSPLKDGFDQLRGDLNEFKETFNLHMIEFNAFVAVYNGHTHNVTATGAPTGPVVGPADPSTQSETPSTANISGSKIDEIKTL